MLKNYLLLLIIILSGNCFANDTAKENDTSKVFMMGRKSRANIISFEPKGEHVGVGLDFLFPFIQVPIVRENNVNGKEPALININSAALILTGLMAASGILVSYVFKTYVMLGREEEKSLHKNRRSDNEFENEFWSVLNNFKLVYKNSSGTRVDTSLSGLFDTIDETFQNNGIDLRSCIQKAICKRIQLSASRIFEGNPSAVDKIIDGVLSLKWLKHLLRHTSLKDAIEASFSADNQYEEPIAYCNVKYPKCKWSMPEDNLNDLITTYLKFT